MGLILVTATPMEMQACLSGLLLPEPFSLPTSPGQTVWHHTSQGALGLLLCGVGPVSAGLNLGYALGALASTPPSLVLNLGIGGSYAPDKAPLGSLVRILGEYYPEYGLWTPKGTLGQGIGFAQAELPQGAVYDYLPLSVEPLLPDTAPTLARVVAQNILGKGKGSWHSGALTQGVGVTVAGVSGTPARGSFLAEGHGALVESMEGFALALGTAQWGIPFIAIRAISNHVGFRPPRNWDLAGACAALSSATASIFRGTFFLPREN